MSDRAQREGPREQTEPSLATSIDGQARVEKLVNVGQARDLYFDSHAAPQALFQLEADIPDFVGRESLLAELAAHLWSAPAQGQSAGARVTLHGAPGVGKSALALRLAHEVKGEFPDAQLYVNLGAGARDAARAKRGANRLSAGARRGGTVPGVRR